MRVSEEDVVSRLVDSVVQQAIVFLGARDLQSSWRRGNLGHRDSSAVQRKRVQEESRVDEYRMSHR